MLKKVLLFFLLSSAPLVIFFLHYFGENHYDIPPLNLDNKELYSFCEDTFKEQKDSQEHNWIYLDSFVLKSLFTSEVSKTPKAHLFLLQTNPNKMLNQEYWVNFLRIFQYFPKEEKKLHISLISMLEKAENQALTNAYFQNLGVNYLNVNDFILDSQIDKQEFIICNLRWPLKNVTLNNQHIPQLKRNYAILVDKEKKLRGYYDLLDIIEVDRLIKEVQVLLN